MIHIMQKNMRNLFVVLFVGSAVKRFHQNKGLLLTNHNKLVIQGLGVSKYLYFHRELQLE